MMHPRWMCNQRWHSNQRRPPNKLVNRIAAMYAKGVGFPPVQKTPYVEVDQKLARDIAAYYDRTPDNSQDPFVKKAYRELAREVALQFGAVSRFISLEPFGDDFQPYKDSAEMMEDLSKNRHLWVYAGGADHPMLTREQTWAFRAVHDFFGHAAQGYSFGPRGEENAWMEHAKLFSPMARMALTTETRGQNSWVNFGPFSHLPAEKRPYAEQKGIILPNGFQRHPALVKTYEKWPGFM